MIRRAHLAVPLLGLLLALGCRQIDPDALHAGGYEGWISAAVAAEASFNPGVPAVPVAPARVTHAWPVVRVRVGPDGPRLLHLGRPNGAPDRADSDLAAAVARFGGPVALGATADAPFSTVAEVVATLAEAGVQTLLVEVSDPPHAPQPPPLPAALVAPEVLERLQLEPGAPALARARRYDEVAHWVGRRCVPFLRVHERGRGAATTTLGRAHHLTAALEGCPAYGQRLILTLLAAPGRSPGWPRPDVVRVAVQIDRSGRVFRPPPMTPWAEVAPAVLAADAPVWLAP